MGVIATTHTHEVEMSERPKRVRAYFYEKALQPRLDIIYAYILSKTEEMAEFAKSMIPPYPFIPFDDLPDARARVYAKISILLEISLEQTVRDLRDISQLEWSQIIAEYVQTASGKGDTAAQRKELSDIRMSDKMLALSEQICSYIEDNKIGFAYIRTGGIPSHKITTFIAVMHTEKRIRAI